MKRGVGGRERLRIESKRVTDAKQGNGSIREKKTLKKKTAGCPPGHVNAEKGQRDRGSHSGCTYPINISLLLRKAEVGQTLVLDFPQKIVLEEGLDPRVLVRLAVRVLLP